jgi:hypothetical protein
VCLGLEQTFSTCAVEEDREEEGYVTSILAPFGGPAVASAIISTKTVIAPSASRGGLARMRQPSSACA